MFSICIHGIGLSLWLSAFIGYMIGLVWNYIISVIWIFESRNKSKEVIAVFFIALGGLAWTWLLLYIMVDLLWFDEVIAKMISQIIILLWNFGMRKWFVFAKLM